MQKTAVVTGGTGYLGQAVVRRFISEGFAVHLSAANAKELSRYEGPGNVTVADLADLESARKWASTIDSPVHAVALIAGGFAMKPLKEMAAADFDQMFDMNVRTAANSLSAMIPLMERADGAAAVLVGSQSYEGAAGMALYAASKAAVVSLSRSAALELRKQKIRVNAILPNTIDTPANRSAMPDADFDKWAKPDEIADVISFLCSSSSVLVSGMAVRVGRTL